MLGKNLIAADLSGLASPNDSKGNNAMGGTSGNQTPMTCTNCSNSTLWRRGCESHLLCIACWYNLSAFGVARPVPLHMRRGNSVHGADTSTGVVGKGDIRKNSIAPNTIITSSLTEADSPPRTDAPPF